MFLYDKSMEKWLFKILGKILPTAGDERAFLFLKGTDDTPEGSSNIGEVGNTTSDNENNEE